MSKKESNPPQTLARLQQNMAILRQENDGRYSLALKALEKQREALIAQQQTLVAQPADSQASAQIHSTAVGAGTIYIAGNAEGSMNNVGNGNVQTGGIRAKNIKAKNVVGGAQMLGGAAADAMEFAKAAQQIQGGGISAREEIEADNVVERLQYIADPTHASLDTLRQAVEALRTQLEKAIQAGEFTDAAAAEDATEDLDKVSSELAKTEPNGGRIMRKLDSASEILIKTSETAEAAENIGGYLGELLPYVPLLTQLAQSLFG